jgi:hypothetical protein
MPGNAMCCWHYTYVGRDNSVGTEIGLGLEGPVIESPKVYGLWGGSKPSSTCYLDNI